MLWVQRAANRVQYLPQILMLIVIYHRVLKALVENSPQTYNINLQYHAFNKQIKSILQSVILYAEVNYIAS